MVLSVVVAKNPLEAAQRVARDRVCNGASAKQVLAVPSVFVGSVDQIVEAMRARRERYGLSYHDPRRQHARRRADRSRGAGV